jgi:hypothetical protein
LDSLIWPHTPGGHTVQAYKDWNFHKESSDPQVAQPWSIIFLSFFFFFFFFFFLQRKWLYLSSFPQHVVHGKPRLKVRSTNFGGRCGVPGQVILGRCDIPAT